MRPFWKRKKSERVIVSKPKPGVVSDPNTLANYLLAAPEKVSGGTQMIDVEAQTRTMFFDGFTVTIGHQNPVQTIRLSDDREFGVINFLDLRKQFEKPATRLAAKASLIGQLTSEKPIAGPYVPGTTSDKAPKWFLKLDS